MIIYFTLLLSIPLGILFAKITGWEKEIYTKPHYFPSLVWIIALLAAIFLSINKTIGMSLLFTFLTTLVWWQYSLRFLK
jgi:hypothetical protein